MKLTILGCHAATPKTFHNPTAQLLEVKGHLFLIDCGEATQVALRKTKIKFARIKHIFISHLHGDHVYGLIGLIATFALLGRKTPLYIHGPKGIKEMITLQLKLGNSWTSFELLFNELTTTTSTCIFEDLKVEVHTLPLNHRVYTNGYLFKEKPGDRKINLKAAHKAQIDKSYFNKLKAGGSVKNNQGELILNESVTLDPIPPKSYAYCSDTAYHKPLLPLIKNCTALYHESTFLEQHLHLCEKTKHSTAAQAAQIAKKANVNLLILGHFSTRYSDLSAFLNEAIPIFKNTILAEDFKEINI